MPQVWTCKFNSEHEWSNNFSNTNGVTKSPTALLRRPWCVAQLDDTRVGRGTFVPWRVPVEKQQQPNLTLTLLNFLSFAYYSGEKVGKIRFNLNLGILHRKPEKKIMEANPSNQPGFFLLQVHPINQFFSCCKSIHTLISFMQTIWVSFS